MAVTDVSQLSRPEVGDAVAASGHGRRRTATWPSIVRPRLVRLARRILWNLHDAEEIVQEAMILACRKCRCLTEPGRRDAWLVRTTVNLSMNRLRLARRHRIGPLVNEPVSEQRHSSDRLEGDELATRTRELVQALPRRQQAALVLHDMEGLTYEQVAAILKSRPGACRVLVHRARETIRRQLMKRWPELLD